MFARSLAALATLVLLCGCDVVAQARSALTSPADRIIAAPLDTAVADRERNDPQGVLAAIAPATDPKVFPTLSQPTQAQVLRLYGWALTGLRRYDAAEEVYRQLAANPYVEDADQFRRLRNASLDEDPAEAAAALPLVLRQPDLGDLGYPSDVQMLDFTLGGLADPLSPRRRLGDALELVRWPARTDALEDGGALEDRQIVWLHYAEALVQDDPGKAAAIARRITRPDLLVALAADRRFDAIVAADPARFDPVAAADRAVKEADARVTASPERLAFRIALAKAQAQAGDYPGAERTLTTAIAVARSGGPPGAMYHDPCPCYVDALIWRAAMMVSNGRAQAALDALGDIAASQDVDPNDMRLRQARLLLMLDRLPEAEGLLNDLDEATLSGYARLERAALQACTVTGRGDPARAAVPLAYLEAHRAISVDLFLDGEICAGNPDHTASMLITMLKQPGTRAAALFQLQGVPAWPHDYAYRVRERQGREALAARPDVAAAVGAVGHLRAYAIQRLTNGV